MSEEPEIPEEQALDLSRWMDLVRRRHMQFLLPLFIGWLLVWGSSWFLQPRYKSSTLILVEEPTMPKNYVVPNVNDDLQGRLQSITQQILSRTRLLYIIDELNLYGDKKGLTPDDKVEMMRKDIGDIELVQNREGAITSFRVNYTASSPIIAQRVTSRLTNLFIDENLKVRQEQSQSTTQFIQNQLDQARTSLATQDAKIKQFQAAHEGELPEQQSSNLQILGGLQAQYQNEQQALNTARQQKIYFQTMIDQYHTLGRSSAAPDGTGGGGLAAIDAQLEKMRSQLADLRSQYTDSYPDVVQLKEQIAHTEKTRSRLVAELKANPPKPSASASQDQLEASQNPQLIQLQGQLHSTEVDIQNREQALAALSARIGEYQGRLSAAPASQQQMADLTRGYDQSKANFDDLLKKENESRMATSMEQMQEGERFTILDPPSLPLKPSFPDRLKMCGMGLAAGAVLGLLIVGLLEFLDDRIHSDKQIKKLLPVNLLSEVPEVLTTNDQTRGRRRVILGWAAMAIVLLCILAGSAFSYLQS
jgi:polysaccharide biosynthesis transport protein